MGCTVVFKASELCPRTHHFLCEAWTEAGLPRGVLNVLQTRREDAPSVTEALIAHLAIRKVEFIGSRAVGNIIGQIAAKYTKPVFMELGGKSAAIVLDDAKLDQAVHLCLMGGKYKLFLRPLYQTDIEQWFSIMVRFASLPSESWYRRRLHHSLLPF